MGYFLDNVPRNGSFVLHDTRKRPKKEKKKRRDLQYLKLIKRVVS